MSLKRQREDADEKLQEKSTPNDEKELACKKKRSNEESNEEINEFSIDAVKCRICLDVVSCTTMRSLPCAHTFHENCLYQWLELSIVCPLCKWPTVRQIWQNYEDGNDYQDEDDDYASGESSDEYPLVGSIGEYPLPGSRGEYPLARLRSEYPLARSSGESQPSGSRSESSSPGSSGEPQPSGSSVRSAPVGSNGRPRRLNVLDLYAFYVWSDDSDYEGEEY